MSFSLVSKYRTELMGYAIVGVLIGHILVFGSISTSGARGVLSWLSYLIHTSGFLFLSGFGVYYSLKKDSQAGHFYQRRFYRFMLPFLFMAVPYFLVVVWSNHSGVLSYLGYVSTAAFWYHGNYHGMWYIAISLLLYIVIPPLFCWYTKSYKMLWGKILITLLAVFAVNDLLRHFYTDYWEMVAIGLRQIPCFFVGIFFAHLSSNVPGRQPFLITMIALGVAYVANQIWPVVPRDYMTPLVSVPFFILLFSMLFSLTDRFGWLRWINVLYKWFGKYTLELYLLHIYLWFIAKEVLHLGALGNIVLAVVLAIVLAFPVHWVTKVVCSSLQKEQISNNSN